MQGKPGNALQLSALYQLVKVVCTLLVSIATTGRSFLSIKLLQTHHRTTMNEDGTSDLLVLTLNHDLSAQVDHEDALDNFTALCDGRTAL
jgi:hypothetical protein